MISTIEHHFKRAKQWVYSTFDWAHCFPIKIAVHLNDSLLNYKLP